MKILILSAAKSVHTAKWANAMLKRGHNIVLVYNKGHEAVDNSIDCDVQHIKLKYGGTAGYYLNAGQLAKTVNKIKPDIINVHYASGYGTLARRAMLNKNFLLSIWGSDVYDFPYQSSIKYRILRKNVEYAGNIASTSVCMALQLRNVMQNPNMDIKITPFGVDLKLFNPDKLRRKVASDTVIIGNIKALEKVYNIDKLIKAFHILQERLRQNTTWDKKLILKIYGSGSERESLQELVEELELGNTVSFEGKIPNKAVPRALSELDVFCALSEKESFGVAIVEAMAMKVPVIVSEADGFKEIVDNRENGIIVDANDISQVARSIEEMLCDEECRKTYGDRGRIKVEQFYDWEKNVDSMEEIYNEIFAKE